MNSPVFAICNFIDDAADLRKTAVRHGFSGVDWTLKIESMPRNETDESRLARKISMLNGLEVRYHCAFKGVDLGDEDDLRAAAAMGIFKNACRLVSRLDGKFMTVHLGLGRRSPEGLSWNRTLDGLAELVSYAQEHGVRLCLENLASGWSSSPQLFEKLVRKTNAGVTLDVGHARVCDSVQCQMFELEDFVMPHPARVLNAHIYHEEVDGRHVPPASVDDIRGRLDLLRFLSCNWWVLELREEAPLLATMKVVREYFEGRGREAQSG